MVVQRAALGVSFWELLCKIQAQHIKAGGGGDSLAFYTMSGHTSTQ